MKKSRLSRYLFYLVVLFALSVLTAGPALGRYVHKALHQNQAQVANIAYEFKEINAQSGQPGNASYTFLSKGATSTWYHEEEDESIEDGDEGVDGEEDETEEKDTSFTSKTSRADPLFYLVCEVREFTVRNTGETALDFYCEVAPNGSNPPGFHWAWIDMDQIITYDDEETHDSDYLIYDDIAENDAILNYPKIIKRLGSDLTQPVSLPVGAAEKRFLLVLWVDYWEISENETGGLLQEPRRDLTTEAPDRHVPPASHAYTYNLKHQAIQRN